MRDFFTQQVKNFFIWAVMFIAFGCGLYFILPTEPIIEYPIIATLGCAYISCSKYVGKFIRLIFAFLFGFLYTFTFTNFLSVPHLTHSGRDIQVTGTIQDIDFLSDKIRVILSVNAQEIGIDTDRNANLRLTVMKPHELNIGDKISAKIGVFPPSPPETIGAFDFSRWAYFNKITGTGFISEYSILPDENLYKTNSIRTKIHNSVNSFLTDGLILGYKNALPKSEKQIWVNAGIGHIWSISGFHMTLVGGWLFALFYFLIRPISYITKRIPARIPATICAWIGLFAYIMISGYGVATMRAFLMTSLVFIAIIFGRNVISIRNIAIVFLSIFLYNPYFITSPGFQLSFSAIFGIIWFWNNKKLESDWWGKKIYNALYTMIMTTFIATIFTLPFIATHFNSIQVYGIIGNIILVPIFSLIIMPLVIIGTIFAIFDFGWVLGIANYVYNFALKIAQYIANMPISNIHIPYISNTNFVLFILGLMGLIFIIPDKKSRYFIHKYINYIIYAICTIIGIIIIYISPKPVFYITPDHELVGFVYDNKLEFNKARASNHYFAFNSFRQLNGELPNNTNKRHKCDKGVCIYKTNKFTIAYIQKFVPLSNNIKTLCDDQNINYITSYFEIKSKYCGKKILDGGFVIYPSGKIKYIQSNRAWFNNQHQ